MTPTQVYERVANRYSPPTTTGHGDFYRIDIRPRSEFVLFRLHDAGEPGGPEYLTGKRQNGSWATVSWIVNKHHAHPIGDVLIIDDPKDRTVLRHIQEPITHILGDIYAAKPRRESHTMYS